MNVLVVKSAVGTHEKILSKAKEAFWQVESEAFGGSSRGHHGSYDYPGHAMAAYLEELHDNLLPILESADMPETRSSLIEAWTGFTATKNGLRDMKDDGEFEYSESPALVYLEQLVQGLRITTNGESASEEA